MKLYHFPKTRSSRVLWLAKELGVELDLVPVDLLQRAQYKPDYVAINPHSKVPAFEDASKGVHLIESGAIATWLVENAPNGENFVPPKGSVERSQYWEWLFYVNATLDELTIPAYLHAKVLPEPARNPAVVETATKAWRDNVVPFIEGRLGDKTWACGDRFTVADIFLSYDLGLAAGLGFLAGHPRLEAYLARATERPAFKAAFA